MEDNEILTQLNTIFSKELRKPVTLSAGTTAADVQGWDSLTHMMIIDSVERHFAVKFKLAEMMQFNNVGDMMTCIKNKLHK